MKETSTGDEVSFLFNFQDESLADALKERLAIYDVSEENTLLTFLKFDYRENQYVGRVDVDQFQTDLEFKTFAGIVIFTVAFGILVILLLKPLKRLTHGAEEKEVEGLEAEGFELADDEVK